MEWYGWVIIALIGINIYWYMNPDKAWSIADSGVKQIESFTKLNLHPAAQTQTENIPTECPMTYDPVCGFNVNTGKNETYLNSCDAAKSKVYEYKVGACWG